MSGYQTPQQGTLETCVAHASRRVDPVVPNLQGRVLVSISIFETEAADHAEWIEVLNSLSSIHSSVEDYLELVDSAPTAMLKGYALGLLSTRLAMAGAAPKGH